MEQAIKALSVQFAIELLLLLCIALIGGLLLVEMSMSRFLNFMRIESSLYYGEIFDISSGSNHPVVSVCADAIILFFVVEHCRKRSKEVLLLPVRTYFAE